MHMKTAAGLGILSASLIGLLFAAVHMPYPVSAEAAAAALGMIVGWKSGRPG